MPKVKRTTAVLSETLGLNPSLDLRTKDAKKLTRFLRQDEAEQFESVRKNLSLLNYYLSNQAIDIAKSGDAKGLRELVQLCTAFGISYDKMYSKRDPGIRPLSFPEPLLKMVKKGLELSNSPAVAKAPEVSVAVSEVPTPTPEPAKPSRYKTSMMQQAHEQLCSGVAIEPKTKGINPRAEYRKQWAEKQKQKQAALRGGGEACAGMEMQGGGLSPQAVAETNESQNI